MKIFLVEKHNPLPTNKQKSPNTGVKTIKLQKMEQIICMFIYEYDLKHGQKLGMFSEVNLSGHSNLFGSFALLDTKDGWNWLTCSALVSTY